MANVIYTETDLGEKSKIRFRSHCLKMLADQERRSLFLQRRRRVFLRPELPRGVSRRLPLAVGAERVLVAAVVGLVGRAVGVPAVGLGRRGLRRPRHPRGRLLPAGGSGRKSGSKYGLMPLSRRGFRY